MVVGDLIHIIDDAIHNVTMKFIITSSSVDYDKSRFAYSLYSELIYELEILREKSIAWIEAYGEALACSKAKDVLENKILKVSTFNGYYGRHVYEKLLSMVDKRLLDFDKE